MRLVRELLAADADPAVAQVDTAALAPWYLEIVSTGLGLRAAALLVFDAGGRMQIVASTLPASARELLADPTGRGAALARRATEEKRALLARRTSDDPLVRALHEADSRIETVAILPLGDRRSIGVLLLAGDESTLATEVVRTLNPALRLLALLVSPQRHAAPGDPSADAARLEALAAERDAHLRTVLTLEAQVAELEVALAAERVQTHATPVTAPVARERVEIQIPRPGDAPAVAMPAVHDGPRTVVVIDTAPEWARYTIPDREVVLVAPNAEALDGVRAANPERIAVNIAAPGVLAHMVRLRAHGVTAPMIGVVAQAVGDHVIGLGLVEAVGHPATAEALVAAISRASPRGARVFAAARDADQLLKVRQTLAKQGLSVSLARDTKQIDELLAMVRPQVVVIDLALPMRQGYELVMRMAMTSPVPSLVLIAPDGDPGPMLLEKARDRFASGMGVGAQRWLVEIAVQKLATSGATRPKVAAAAAH